MNILFAEGLLELRSLSELLRTALPACVHVAETAEQAHQVLRQLVERRAPLDVLITHAHFFRDSHRRDYEVSASLCRFAKENWPNVTIVCLHSTFSDRFIEQYGFPDSVVTFNPFFEDPTAIVKVVREATSREAMAAGVDD